MCKKWSLVSYVNNYTGNDFKIIYKIRNENLLELTRDLFQYSKTSLIQHQLIENTH
jgi:hypothetical protein